MSNADVPKIINDLVNRFSEHICDYKSGRYKEEQVCAEFILPMFEALGWDIANREGCSEAYKDVIHHDSIKTGVGTKAPDYCFRIGGVRKFFLEAKKPSVSVRDEPYPAFQLRRYAWSAKLPLGIVTDFEEFAVYDCRTRPIKSDKASTSRILYLKYDQYLERWDEISGVFSKNAILKGSFDKYAEGAKGRRGTAGVDDAFLEEIERWRQLLAQGIAQNNKRLDVRNLNFAVQAIIDRIIFLRICEDHGFESYGQLMALQNGPHVYDRLVEIFRHADKRYNSGLFHFVEERGRATPIDTLTPKLKIDDSVLRTIFENLYYPQSPYEFSVIPAEILGQAYERFLGKVIHLTPTRRAKIEEKPEVRKAGGVYYTPSYIVDYIVQNTVGELLEGKTPKEAARFRILDPACGSGSFLIGAYDHLMKWHLEWYTHHNPERWAKGKTPALYKIRKDEWALTFTEQKRILTDNLYGVDIDPQAVEVTKLSLLLKLLEGLQQRELFREHALPDLGSNIKCGNSLIGPEFYKNQMDFFTDEERMRINVFDWDGEFSAIMKSGGFDTVIGNPPYGAYLGEMEKEYLHRSYTCQNYQLDSYLLFLERTITKLINGSGYYGMIIPNPWLTNLLQTNVRKFVTTKTRMVEIVHFLFPVFDDATVDTQIVILRRMESGKWETRVSIVESADGLVLPTPDNIKIIKHDQDKWKRLNGGTINIFMDEDDDRLAHKCLQRTKPLDELCVINVGIKPYQVGKGKPPQTRNDVENRSFDSASPKTPMHRQYLRGCDIGRYLIAPLQRRYLKYGPWLAEPRPAADFDVVPKIVMRQTGDGLIAALDIDKYLCLNNMHVIVPRKSQYDPSYLLGIVNSTLLNWYYRTLNPEVGEALAEVKKTNVARLPVRQINFSNKTDKSYHDKLVKYVNLMFVLNKKITVAKTPHVKTALQRQIYAIDNEIDRLVYELYGLTKEEIKIVEESVEKE